jgi:putative protein-disulfide isomerase
MHFIYFADPMCSWCWGFSKAIEAIAAHFDGRLPVRTVMGGLRPYTREPWPASERAMIREHWGHVHDRTGQSFDFARFAQDDFVYDTEPGARAVVTARGLGEPGADRAMLARLHRAFYAEGRDITDEATLADIGVEAGFDRALFAAALASEEARQATRLDFAVSRQAGVQGFPTLIVGAEADGYTLVTSGYQPAEAMIEPLERWLAQRGDPAGVA